MQKYSSILVEKDAIVSALQLNGLQARDRKSEEKREKKRVNELKKNLPC
jgi:hypothetical protein